MVFFILSGFGIAAKAYLFVNLDYVKIHNPGRWLAGRDYQLLLELDATGHPVLKQNYKPT
jgi:hypothetical protein